MRNGVVKRNADKLSELFLIKELADFKGLRRFWIRWTRIFAIAAKEFFKNKCSLTASALTYVTLVSIVPVLAFAFSIGKGLGFQNKLKDFLINKVAASVTLNADNSAGGVSLALEKIFNYIEKTNFETLGAIGVVMLVYLVIKLLGNIENVFNDIWGVTAHRSMIRKLSDYLSVIVIFPMFVLIAATSTAALTSSKFLQILYNEGSIGLLIKFLLSYSSYLFLWLAFFAIYMFMPNTKVKFSSALIGGIIGGTSWEIVQWAYFHFQVGISNYNIIYSTLAALPIFLAWLYLSWLILLFGAELTFAHQMVDTYSFGDAGRKLIKKTRDVLALSIVGLIAGNFAEGKKPIGIKHLSDAMGVKPEVIKPVLDNLCEKNIVYASEPDKVYLLSVAPDKLLTLQVLDAVSGSIESGININRINPAVYRFYTEMEKLTRDTYKEHTIADIMKGK
jgi:membrane protein